MDIRINRASPVPIHEQIKDQIVGLIHAGKVKPGDQLPTMRALSIDLAVNFNTVAHAYRELDAQGIITTRQGQGTYVAGLPGDGKLEVLRHQKLEALVKALFDEADRLGYSAAEVQHAIREHLAQVAKE